MENTLIGFIYKYGRIYLTKRSYLEVIDNKLCYEIAEGDGMAQIIVNKLIELETSGVNIDSNITVFEEGYRSCAFLTYLSPTAIRVVVDDVDEIEKTTSTGLIVDDSEMYYAAKRPKQTIEFTCFGWASPGALQFAQRELERMKAKGLAPKK